MVIFRDLHWERGNLVQKQEVRQVLLVDAKMGVDKAILGYLHWESRLLRSKK